MLYNPLFKSERFRRVTNDRFFIVIDATDPKFDEASAARVLREAGCRGGGAGDGLGVREEVAKRQARPGRLAERAAREVNGRP